MIQTANSSSCGGDIHDEYGTSQAMGDFNHDGRDDLAAGLPNYNVGEESGAGAVWVIDNPIPPESSSKIWHQDSPLIDGAAEENDRFGYVVTKGDFNHDGYDDLVVGVPYEDVGTTVDAGAVNIIYGSSSGLTSVKDQLLYRGATGVIGSPGGNDQFGAALTVGDFNGDSYDDLAVGVPGDDIADWQAIVKENAGSVQVFYGTASGLDASGEIWSRETTDISGFVEVDDFFGSALAAGDFNGDSYTDLAIGVPSGEVGPYDNAGVVQIIYGSASGLTSASSQYLHEGTAGLDGVFPTNNDYFGTTLAAGDLNGDGRADLAIYVPNASVNYNGLVHVLYGSSEGITTQGNDYFFQGASSLPGEGYAAENFGASLVIIPPARDFPGPLFFRQS